MTNETRKPGDPKRRAFLRNAGLLPAGLYLQAHASTSDEKNAEDAAAWSAVIPLSEASNSDRGNSRDFPDFTRGAWKDHPPLEVAEY